MVFASFDELLSMGGHGPYVWAAYLVTVAALVVLVALPLLSRRRQLHDIARRARRDAANANHPGANSVNDSIEE